MRRAGPTAAGFAQSLLGPWGDSSVEPQVSHNLVGSLVLLLKDENLPGAAGTITSIRNMSATCVRSFLM